MKKNRGRLINSIAQIFINLIMAFILVIVLLPINILAQNNQSNSIPAKAVREQSSFTIPSYVVPPKSPNELSPSPEPTPEPTPEIAVTLV
jgi:hypothetical protein